MPLLGLSMASSTIVGQCLGCDNINRAKKTAFYASFYGVVIMAIASIIAFIVPNTIMAIFVKEASVIETGVPMIRIVNISLIFAAITMGYGSVFSGSGYNKPYLISSVVGRWGVQIPLMYVIVNLLRLPVIWIWFTFVAADLAEMLVILYSYNKGKWEVTRV
ncbi:MATE family efflux transporter [Fervidicella metallireducens]|uniref:MATE family efflux transporter n=1 Tax=Fervidicella metallireducens TaxID=655338 RepID=UPI001FA77312|nr:MATE family efflux transporter [Fervidicella metallireducens]